MSREVVKHSGQARLTAIFNVFIFISLFQAIWGPRLLAVKKSIISGKKSKACPLIRNQLIAFLLSRIQSARLRRIWITRNERRCSQATACKIACFRITCKQMRQKSKDYRALKRWKSKQLRWANIMICVVRLIWGIKRLLFSMFSFLSVIESMVILSRKKGLTVKQITNNRSFQK